MHALKSRNKNTPYTGWMAQNPLPFASRYTDAKVESFDREDDTGSNTHALALGTAPERMKQGW